MVTGVTAVLATMVAAGPALPAGAITGPPSAPQGYGFDNTPNLIVGGGSDTTAKAMLNITDLYNASAVNNGCHHDTSSTATQNKCDGTTDQAYNQSNWDGDTVGEANPTGSGGGRNALLDLNGIQTYNGTANSISNPGRTDAVTFTTGSATVADTAITAADRGKLVTSTDPGLPKPVYVGTVTAGTGFSLSATADPSQQKDDPYTGAGGAGSIVVSRYGCVPAATSPGPVPDFGRSSSTPTLTGQANCGSELNASTFWGFGQDQIEVVGFNSHGAKLNSLTGGSLSAVQLDNIWGCKNGTGTLINGHNRMTWSDIDPTVFAGDHADIIPWQMNTGSGTYNQFKAYVAGASGDASFDPNTSGGTGCARALNAGGSQPLENDVKPLINDPSNATFGTGNDNPENWLWWSSFGVLSAFPFTSGVTRAGTLYQATAAAVGTGTSSFLPSTSLTSQYPIKRTLWNVSRKGDADCPAVLTAGVRTCDFTGQPGPTIGAGPTTDLNVAGATTGPGGAVREFMRFICRQSAAQQGLDPYTGNNQFLGITSAINGAGFTVLPAASRTPGSRCQVLT